MKFFVTGAAGFIGYHLVRRLLTEGHEVCGYDGLTPYYDVELKHTRVRELSQSPSFRLVEGMLEDGGGLRRAVEGFAPEVIIHLAAQAGVRYSLEVPEAYITSNLVGTFNVLEAARSARPRHLLLASTSSVYGGNEGLPFHEGERTDFPLSLYAATKKGCEAMSHSYAHLWGLPTTCFRFFTVYGPSGRPDMALFKFVSAITNGDPVDVYGHGLMRRDCTFVEDLVEAVVRLVDAVPVQGQPAVGRDVVDSLSPVAPWRTVNIAGGTPVPLLEFIGAVEAALERTAVKRMLPMQAGDVMDTCADTALLEALTGYVPSTPLTEWVGGFVDWYRAEHAKVLHG